MSKDTGIVFNIQRYTIHDGPGIRTEVFLKGCPLSCKWCSNPEGISPQPEVGVYPDKCLGKDVCGACLEVCSLGGAPLLFGAASGKIGAIDRAICVRCQKCTTVCYMRALKAWGVEMSVDDVMKEVVADKQFYANSGGGITISGGESTMQWEFTLSLLKACRDERIHTCVESCLVTSPAILDKLLPLTDLFITDIKNMDSAAHRRWTGAGNERILSNVIHVVESGTPLIIRIPVVPGVNDSEENIRSTAQFIVDKLGNKVAQVQLLTYLKMGEDKYDSLGISYPMGEDFQPAKADERQPWINHLAELMRDEYGIKAYAGATKTL